MEKKSSPAVAPKKKPSHKAAPKKKAESKKTKEKKAAPKKTSPSKKKIQGSKAVTKKPVPKKAPSKKKTAPSGAVKRKSAATSKTKKGPVSGKKQVSLRDLLIKKFDISAPSKKYTPPSVERKDAEISSPPFFIGESQEETERVRRLLFKRFDLTIPSGKVVAGFATESTSEPLKAARRQDDAVALSPEAPGGAKASAVFPHTGIGVASPTKKPLDPTVKMVAIGLGILVFLVVLVLCASVSNVRTYYVKKTNDKVEIWKGRFSPNGEEKMVTLDKTALPANLKKTYGREEAFPLIFEGIMNNTDALLNREEIPDFDLIRRELTNARPFAISEQMSNRLQQRLDKLDMMALVYKADVLAGKGTTEDLNRARESLEKALTLNLDEAEKGLIEQKIAWVDQKLSEIAGELIREKP